MQAVELRLWRGVRDQQAGHHQLRLPGGMRANRPARVCLKRKNLRQSVRDETIRMQEEEKSLHRLLRNVW